MNRFRFFVFGTLLAATMTAFAQAPPVKPQWTGFQFYEENDVFAFKNTSDRHYTQGLRVTRTLDPATNPQWLLDLSQRLCRRCTFSFEPVLHAGIGQSIYTPSHTKIAAPQTFDRPWAGWLYVTTILDLTEQGSDPKKREMIEVDLGIVGPGAGAARAQSTIHKLIGSAKPLGWHNQIGNQPGINIIYLHNRRVGTDRADFVWDAGGDLGNVQTYATAGVVGRLGYNITGFPGSPLAATAGGRSPRKTFEAYVFAGGDGRAVLHNIFITGGDSQIDPKRLVFDTRVGGSLRWRSVRFTYNYVRRTREFTSPAPLQGTHDFGSFAIAWEPALNIL